MFTVSRTFKLTVGLATGIWRFMLAVMVFASFLFAFFSNFFEYALRHRVAFYWQSFVNLTIRQFAVLVALSDFMARLIEQ